MRLKLDKEPTIGDKRTYTRFALLPVETDDGFIVWLEKYNVHQLYEEVVTFDFGMIGSEERWVTVKRTCIGIDYESTNT